MKNKKTFFNRLTMLKAKNTNHQLDLIRDFSNLMHENGDYLEPEDFETWVAIVNEEKETVVMISPTEHKYVMKPMKGDKFSIVKGMALAAFEENTGIRYQDLRRLTELFAETTKKCDPAMNIILHYFFDATGHTEESILNQVKTFPVGKDGNKKFVITIPSISTIEDMISHNNIEG